MTLRSPTLDDRVRCADVRFVDPASSFEANSAEVSVVAVKLEVVFGLLGVDPQAERAAMVVRLPAARAHRGMPIATVVVRISCCPVSKL
jgi:hypothetical protein